MSGPVFHVLFPSGGLFKNENKHENKHEHEHEHEGAVTPPPVESKPLSRGRPRPITTTPHHEEAPRGLPRVSVKSRPAAASPRGSHRFSNNSGSGSPLDSNQQPHTASRDKRHAEADESGADVYIRRTHEPSEGPAAHAHLSLEDAKRLVLVPGPRPYEASAWCNSISLRPLFFEIVAKAAVAFDKDKARGADDESASKRALIVAAREMEHLIAAKLGRLPLIGSKDEKKRVMTERFDELVWPIMEIANYVLAPGALQVFRSTLKNALVKFRAAVGEEDVIHQFDEPCMHEAAELIDQIFSPDPRDPNYVPTREMRSKSPGHFVSTLLAHLRQISSSRR